MSKTFNALKEADQLRKGSPAMAFSNYGAGVHHPIVRGLSIPKEKYAAFNPEHASAPGNKARDNGAMNKQNSVFQNTMLMVVAFIGLMALLLNLKTLSEVRRANDSSILAAGEIALQKNKIHAIEKSLVAMQLEGESRLKSLTDQLAATAMQHKKDRLRIEELTAANGELRSALGDLKWQAQNLTDKFMGMNAKLKSLEEKQ